jgi:NAD+ kinase
MADQIGVLAHPLRPNTAPLAIRLCEVLCGQGATAWYATVWTAQDIQQQVAESRMVIAIGGDGAMLRAARVCAPFGVPVLGINMGQVGFLAELSVDAWERHLTDVLEARYWIEERMMIQAEVRAADGQILRAGPSLNDVVISGGTARMAQFETYIDGGWATTYHADALIIATATGSTAYALACGGPILPPELRNILIVPVAPHLSMERPIVLSEGARVTVAPKGRTPITLMLDGAEMGQIQTGERVTVGAGPHSCRFVRLRERNYFYRSLLDRLEPRLERNGQERPNLQENE